MAARRSVEVPDALRLRISVTALPGIVGAAALAWRVPNLEPFKFMGLPMTLAAAAALALGAAAAFETARAFRARRTGTATLLAGAAGTEGAGVVFAGALVLLARAGPGPVAPLIDGLGAPFAEALAFALVFSVPTAAALGGDAGSSRRASGAVRRATRKLLVAACGLLLLLAPVEVVARRLLRGRPPVDDVRNRFYRYDARLGWFPREGSGGFMTGNTRVFVRHNSHGFRDREHGAKTKPRLAFLGDSFVWGYDVEERQRFTELVQARLGSLEVLNLGVSGYGNDQELLLLEDRFDALSPDVVFLVFCADNDHENNDSNVVYDGYYKPYFVVEGGAPALRGVPVPRSVNYGRTASPWLFESAAARILVTGLLRAVQPSALRVPDPTKAILAETRRFVEERGARFAVGMQDDDAVVSGFLTRIGVPWVSLANPHRFPGKGHWTPEGHAVVAARIVAFLTSEGLAAPEERPRDAERARSR